VAQFQAWIEGRGFPTVNEPRSRDRRRAQLRSQSILVFATTADNRLELNDRLLQATQGPYVINSTTPLGFFQDEVVLFWPLLIQTLGLSALFPLRLRPETEQELAFQVWQPEINAGLLSIEGVPRSRLVRQLLDLLQVAAFSGTPIEEVADVAGEGLQEGLTDTAIATGLWDGLGGILARWRDWCLQHGFLTYGILTELYWRHLLPQPSYQEHLLRRFRGVLADDVDNYPAIARDLFELLLDQGVVGLFTFNPNGAIRLGLGGDPQYLLGLNQRCQQETLADQPLSALSLDSEPVEIEQTVTDLLETPTACLPDTVTSIQTVSRSQLLRRVGETIIQAIHSGAVAPQDIAVIGPGLDAIARYTLIEILTRKGIAVDSLNDQRPLNSSALVRSLLTLLALIYPGCGRWVERDQVAEMLVVLSLEPKDSQAPGLGKIDPVRAGLLADYCFVPHPEQPQLLPAESFTRWDRLGYAATTAYQNLLQWIEQQRAGLVASSTTPAYLTLSPVFILDRAIQQFLWPNNLDYNQLANLRELIETTQHYWEVHRRVRQTEPGQTESGGSTHSGVADLIQLLRGGTITANPFPLRARNQPRQAVTLATAFQYRSARQRHRWHFWLDVGGPLWYGGGAVILWGAPMFLKHRYGQVRAVEEVLQDDQAQLGRLLIDLFNRVDERVFLCHSDLSVTGQEQVGPLLPMVDISIPLTV
jgi:hypothetical protein